MQGRYLDIKSLKSSSSNSLSDISAATIEKMLRDLQQTIPEDPASADRMARVQRKYEDRTPGNQLFLLKGNTCGLCTLKHHGCTKCREKLRVKILEDQTVYDSGRYIAVFARGDIVEGLAHVKEGVVYCIKAQSPYYYCYYDFISLDQIEVSKTGNRI
jgi:hypothetical protein